VGRCRSNHGISRGTKEKPRRGRRGFLPRTVSTGAGGLEGPTVRMINAHALRQFRADPADRALVLPHVRGASVRACSVFLVRRALPLIPRFQTYCCEALSDALGQSPTSPLVRSPRESRLKQQPDQPSVCKRRLLDQADCLASRISARSPSASRAEPKSATSSQSARERTRVINRERLRFLVSRRPCHFVRLVSSNNFPSP
jgi:hypothetical protein